MAASGARAHANVTNINLASSTGKKVQSTDDILKQIESTLPDVSQQNLARGGLSARLQGRLVLSAAMCSWGYVCKRNRTWQLCKIALH